MRIIAIQPGAQFSTFDVHRGWVKAFRALGHEVGDINFGEQIDVFWHAHIALANGKYRQAFERVEALHMARQYLKTYLWDFAPDLIFVTSGPFLSTDWCDNVRARGQIPIVMLCTESPYEDDWQRAAAEHVDLVLLNDPTHLAEFRELNPNSHYMPHAYDPTVHYPREPDPDIVSDCCFVGTFYRERLDFLEQVDWTGIDLTLAGDMQFLVRDRDYPLLQYMAHDLDECIPNDETVRLYTSSRTSLNLYRKMANHPQLVDGWAMGPRELELAACGVPYLREPRGEGDQVLPMLPTFDGPDDFEKKLRYLLDHEDERLDIAEQARAAVADRTFDMNASRLLDLFAQL